MKNKKSLTMNRFLFNKITNKVGVTIPKKDTEELQKQLITELREHLRESCPWITGYIELENVKNKLYLVTIEDKMDRLKRFKELWDNETPYIEGRLDKKRITQIVLVSDIPVVKN